MHEAARQRCDELWPVIVNDVFSRAAQAELDPATAGTGSSTHLPASVAHSTHSAGRYLEVIPWLATYNDSIDLEMSK